jgi:[DsrC]-trisulfide reductase subunit K
MKIDTTFPGKDFKCYPTTPKDADAIGLPFSREWTVDDFKLPPNWKEIFIEKLGELTKKSRSWQLYLDICVRCGACADKCHYFLGTQDPKNMPVARAELLRSVYRRYYTTAGKLFGPLAGARELTEDVIKELYSYYYECSQCRRCSLFCPYGIDTAEITMMARELLISIGLSTKYVTSVIAKVYTYGGNNLGIKPKAFYRTVEFIEEELEETTGLKIKLPVNKKGVDVLMVAPSAEFFSPFHWGTMIGWVKMFHQIGLSYTISTYASEGGNFGLFFSHNELKKITQRIADEAKRLGVKMIIGGECGHQWRVWHNFMDTMCGPLDFLDTKSPITGTDFGTPLVHICEFTEDLIKHNKLNLDPSRNDQYKVVFADSCNPARAMGLTEEPRFILKKACNNYVEMKPEASKERCYCCGSGGGLLTDEIMDLRMKGATPRAAAIKETGADFVALICAICKAAHVPLLEHHGITASVGGVHELLGNALVLEGEKLPEPEPEAAAPEAVGECECELCGATFKTMDECCEHAEKEHQIATSACDMACNPVEAAAPAEKESECELCGATFKTMDECCEHAEKEHQIAKSACDMACKEV